MGSIWSRPERRWRARGARRPGRHRVLGAVAALCCLELAAVPAAAQDPGSRVIAGRVLDEKDGSPVADATVVLRALAAAGARVRTVATAADGAYRFTGLERGRYRLTVERLGYRSVTLLVTLDRDAPVTVTLLAEPVPFPLAGLTPHAGQTSQGMLVPASLDAAAGDVDLRIEGIRRRQARYLGSDVRQLTHADLREANTLLEDDLFRALQRTPGIGARDDYNADLWTRGGAAGQTAILFDGVPLLNGLHALGILSGPSSDMAARATLQPGVASASVQGGGAGVLEIETRSPANAPRMTAFAVSPVSARFTTDGRVGDRFAWAAGGRRSYVDAVSLIGGDLTPASGRVPYAFADLTARADLALSPTTRIEASGYWQDDRVFGDVGDIARGNEGEWGASVARLTVATDFGATRLRHTIGASWFDASVRARSTSASSLHPPLENHFRTLLWESRLSGGDVAGGETWSLGLRASREDDAYRGPGIDLARLLSPEELARRGVPDLIPLIAELERGFRLERERLTRLAVWGERRGRITDDLELQAGLRAESGDRVTGSSVRLAPRLHLRWQTPGSPLRLSAAYGRAWQYVQSVGHTDVVRSGLRVSELLVHASDSVPALRSDVVTLGAELWRGSAWLLGATAWTRLSDGILVPTPTPGALDSPRELVPARGRAHGIELSVRRLEGRVRGSANYALSTARLSAGGRTFDAPQDRRHIVNAGIVADATSELTLGATFRAEGGAPFTRVTLVEVECPAGVPLRCMDGPRVLYGEPGLQRAPAFASLDLMTQWTHAFEDIDLSVYAQLRNALGRGNAVTYHSSCLCQSDTLGYTLGDRFDRGLPRLPVLGVRVRF